MAPFGGADLEAAASLGRAGMRRAGPATPSRAAPLWAAEWNTGLGTGAPALQSGGKFGTVTSGQEIEVVAAPGVSPGFANALRVARGSGVAPGFQMCEVQNAWPLPGIGESLFFRDYLYSELTSLNNTEANHHPIETGYGGAATSGFTLKMQPNGDGTIYVRQAVPSAADGLFGSGLWYFARSDGSGNRVKLANAQWWRFEQQWMRTAVNTWTILFRIYDEALALWGNPATNVRRQTGAAYPIMNTVNTGIKATDSELRKWRLGSNGGTWTNAVAEYFYHGAPVVTRDDWPGPYVPGWG